MGLVGERDAELRFEQSGDSAEEPIHVGIRPRIEAAKHDHPRRTEARCEPGALREHVDVLVDVVAERGDPRQVGEAVADQPVCQCSTITELKRMPIDAGVAGGSRRCRRGRHRR